MACSGRPPSSNCSPTSSTTSARSSTRSLASGALVSSGSEPLLLFHRRQVELERAFREAVEDGELRADVDPVFAATTAVRLGMGVIIDWVVETGDPS